VRQLHSVNTVRLCPVDHATLDLIAEVLLTDSDQRSVAAGLPLIDALDEPIDWLTDTRLYTSHHQRAWTSAATDVDVALTASGPALAGLVGLRLKRFDIQQAIGRAQRREALTADVEELSEARALLISDEGLRAAWADLVASASGGLTQHVRLHLDGLKRIDACRGRAVDQQFRVLAGVLRDRQLDVDDASSWIDPGHESGADDLLVAIDAPAGLAVSDRVELCANSLLSPSPEAQHVVWLAVDRASMPGGVLDAGSIQFFDSRYVTESLKLAPDERSAQLPQEIRDIDTAVALFPSGQFTLLARVAMGRRTSAFVCRDARRRLLTLLAPADRIYADDWRVMPGSVTFRDGHNVGWSVFEDLERTSTRHLDGVAVDWLERTGQKLAGMLPAKSADALDRLLQLVEWDAAHRATAPLTTVLLSIRTIVNVAQGHHGGKQWHDLSPSTRHSSRGTA